MSKNILTIATTALLACVSIDTAYTLLGNPPTATMFEKVFVECVFAAWLISTTSTVVCVHYLWKMCKRHNDG